MAVIWKDKEVKEGKGVTTKLDDMFGGAGVYREKCRRSY
jgi:hypothetical protein